MTGLVPIYEQTLSIDGEVALVKALPVRVDEGSSLKLRCVIAGSSASVSFFHDKADDLAALPDVEIIEGSSSVELSIKKYDHQKHQGVYDCTVRDSKQRLHRRAFRVEERVGESALCDNSFCHKNGLCATDEDGSKFCYCKNGYFGERCEQVGPVSPVLGGISSCSLHLVTIALAFAGVAVIVAALIVFFARRQGKKEKKPCERKPITTYDFINPFEDEQFCGRIRQVLSTESAPEGLLYNLKREDETTRAQIAALNRGIRPAVQVVETPGPKSTTLAVHFIFPNVEVPDSPAAV